MFMSINGWFIISVYFIFRVVLFYSFILLCVYFSCLCKNIHMKFRGNLWLEVSAFLQRFGIKGEAQVIMSNCRLHEAL